MAVTRHAHGWTLKRLVEAGPVIAFGAAVAVAFVTLAAGQAMLSRDAVMPLIASLLFALAAVVALLAWRVPTLPRTNVSYWDVAGALTLIGICAAATIEPEQLALLIESDRARQ